MWPSMDASGADFPNGLVTGTPSTRYAALVAEEFVAAEILYHWSARQNYTHILNVQKAEILKLDVILGELLYRQKRKLSRLGRSGGWK